MTSYEAAIQEERDILVKHRREAIQAQEDEDYHLRYREEAVACIVERHSQLDQPPLPFPSPAPLQAPSSGISSSSPSYSSSSDGEPPEAQRPRRGVRRTQKLVDNSQTAKDIAAVKGGKGKPTRRKPGKKALAAAAEMSQLLDGYVPPPSSAVLLDD
jgi:hypothetical protein